VGNVLTTDDYIQKVPSRLGIGLIGGYGFSYQGVTPYAGIGVTFNLFGTFWI
jgi:opacity protein-like surface antigen